jgi:hypothetical protein
VSDELTAASVTVTTSVDKYTNATIAEAFGPAVGDIYYSDGTYSNNYYANKIPIGIIVSNNSSYCEQTNGYGHGLVMALTDAASNVCWSINNEQSPLTSVSTIAEFKADVSGLNRTKAIKSVSGYETSYPAFNSALKYSVDYPSASSGWFLPSVGQWYETLLNAQTYYNANNESKISIPYSDWNSSIAAEIGTDQAENCAAEINFLFSSKKLNSLYTKIRLGSDTYRYWSSSPNTVNDANSLNFEVAKLMINNPGYKTDTSCRYVRPFLAF